MICSRPSFGSHNLDDSAREYQVSGYAPDTFSTAMVRTFCYVWSPRGLFLPLYWVGGGLSMCDGCVAEAPSPCPFHDPPSIRPSARPFVFSSGFVLVDGSCGWVGG